MTISEWPGGVEGGAARPVVIVNGYTPDGGSASPVDVIGSDEMNALEEDIAEVKAVADATLVLSQTIDGKADDSLALSGVIDGKVDNSVALIEAMGLVVDEALEEIKEVEYHFHNVERWLGAITPAGGKVAGDNLNPFTLTSGNNTYGAAVPMLDVNDTPVMAGKTFYDLHRIHVMDVSSTSIYKIRFSYGTGTQADAITAGQYTELVYRVSQTNDDRGAIDFRLPRLPVGTKVWEQVWNATNGATLQIMFGLHEYNE